MKKNFMKKIFRKLSVSFTFLMLFASYETVLAEAVTAAGALTKVTPVGSVVGTWQAADINNTFIIEGVVGTLSTAPNTWTITDLSNGISALTFLPPHLFSNDNGDVVVMFEYLDSSFNYQVVACMLPVGTTTWNIATISDTSESAGFEDQFASIDESGNIVATWTIYDSTQNVNKIKLSQAVIGTTSTWTTPITLAP